MEFHKDILKRPQKDINNNKDLSPVLNSSFESFISKRTEKLCTALYMVTDFMEHNEPIRRQLRTLAVKLISDIHSGDYPSIASLKSQIISLINIAKEVGIISSMNSAILLKEFSVTKEMIDEKYGKIRLIEDLLKDEDILKDKVKDNYNQPIVRPNVLYKQRPISVLNNLETKSNRKEDILKFIKDKGEVAIKDIVQAISGCSEKTIQRELMSLTKSEQVKKTGAKRWSKYSAI